MEAITLENYGYIKHKIPAELFSKIQLELLKLILEYQFLESLFS